MSMTPPADTPDGLCVRSYLEPDQPAVAKLYDAGLLAGQIAPNDSGADLDYIQQAYFDDERHHFWVAEHEGTILGMIGVASDEEHTAEIRRLRVEGEYQGTGIAAILLETAIAHCKHHGYLKIRLDTRFEKDAAVDLFIATYGVKHDKAVGKLAKDRDVLLAFYNFPAEHWKHIRTTDPPSHSCRASTAGQ